MHTYHYLLVSEVTSSQQNPMKTFQGIQICLLIGPANELLLCLQSLRASEDGPFGLSYIVQANNFLFSRIKKVTLFRVRESLKTPELSKTQY